MVDQIKDFLDGRLKEMKLQHEKAMVEVDNYLQEAQKDIEEKINSLN